MKIFNEYDVIKLSENIDPNLSKGTIGTILMIFQNEDRPNDYEVELINSDGESLGTWTLPEKSLIKVSH